MKDTIFIKITKCPNQDFWYAKFVGQTFSAKRQTRRYAGEEAYEVDITHLPMRVGVGLVNVNNAEIVNKPKTKPLKGE